MRGGNINARDGIHRCSDLRSDEDSLSAEHFGMRGFDGKRARASLNDAARFLV